MFSIVSCTPNLPEMPITDVIPAVEGEEQDRWGGPALPAESGMRIRDQTDAANSAVIAIRGGKAPLVAD